MKPLFVSATLLTIVLIFSASGDDGEEKSTYSAPETFVIVHGATGGGWDWKTIDDLLSADGHTVYRPTLTGLGERMHLSSPNIDLTTHINDIANVILFEDLDDLVLVGHSYGGMVISGVMNLVPERIKHVVFLDAAVPNDGMSAEDLWGEITLPHKVIDGIIHFSWLNEDIPRPRDVPQSLRTYTESVSLNNPVALELPATFVAFVNPGQTLEDRRKDPSWQNAELRGWTIRTLDSDHNAQRSHPRELADLLEESPTNRNRP
jgi:pimeloyl-ACP methyl ester carboxylesterase